MTWLHAYIHTYIHIHTYIQVEADSKKTSGKTGDVARVVKLRELTPTSGELPSILDVRRLIGTKGANVKNLEALTGTRIAFTPDPEPQV